MRCQEGHFAVSDSVTGKSGLLSIKGPWQLAKTMTLRCRSGGAWSSRGVAVGQMGRWAVEAAEAATSLIRMQVTWAGGSLRDGYRWSNPE